ncbi:UPF1 regulator of nonsense transcripts homolog (Yeast), related [Eimeria necatrix]|uniref:UPF1 regulator of nonsense transcripts homolog (Yeast), related n=1 Tax=Eimeria necatrix TaxID=51315 RepID=U6MQ02_9EIME|nr:UPF1 regulator of nonsense transcripts homolog (Yeast), related [Eimeria necatrix]CDJ66307.1 UPF1 regulator of nonsense transcripts homolog (Yeast), related [Eimeria necatrix]
MLVSEAQGALVIVCRDRCYASGILEENGWDSSAWSPLIENKALAHWLVRPLTDAEKISAMPISKEEMQQLEEFWARYGDATVDDVRSEGKP